MSRSHPPLIFTILFIVIAGFNFLFFVKNTRADTSGAVITTVKISVCGNDVKEGGEQCDGNDKSGRTCSYLGYSGGSLGCTASCEFNVSNCDTTAEESITAIFTASAGGSQTLSGEEQSITIELPADFYSDNLRLQMFSHSSTTVSDSKPAPSGGQFLDKAYDLSFFDSSGNPVSTLSRPATITLAYADPNASLIEESSIKPYKFENGSSSWQLISGSTLDTENNTVTFTTSSFSWFALFGSAPSNDIVVSSNSNSPNPGGRRHLVDLSILTAQEIMDYINDKFLIPNIIGSKDKDKDKDKKSISATEKTKINSHKLGINTIGEDGDDHNQVPIESGLKIIIAVLILISIILAHPTILLW